MTRTNGPFIFDAAAEGPRQPLPNDPRVIHPILCLAERILTENIAVLSYIADRSGKLMPANGMPRWRVLETTAFVSTELHKNFKPFLTPDADDFQKDEARSVLQKRFELLEDGLGDRAFIVGGDMTIADCYLFVMLMWGKEKVGISLPTHLNGYYARLKERPAVKKALRDEGLS
jgi:glutathione S-transferase